MIDDPDAPWRERFPALFAEQRLEWARARIRYTLRPPPPEMISRLHLVATTAAGHVVVCRSDLGWRFLPGGTREPGESISELARRELREEAGAELLGDPIIIGSYIADSELPEPYRTHQPHPRAHWAHATAPVEITGPPTNPPDGERVVEVLALPPDDAVSWLAEHDPRQADVLALALARG